MDNLGSHRVQSLRRSGSSFWRSASVNDVFSRSSRNEDDEEALKWAAIEKLPTFERIRKGILIGDAGALKEVEVKSLALQEKKALLERLIGADEDNEKFLSKLKNRMDRVGIEDPTIEVRFENLNIEAEAYVGSRALSTILNFTYNMIEEFAEAFQSFHVGRKIGDELGSGFDQSKGHPVVMQGDEELQ